jgi:hypothetical protein
MRTLLHSQNVLKILKSIQSMPLKALARSQNVLKPYKH